MLGSYERPCIMKEDLKTSWILFLVTPMILGKHFISICKESNFWFLMKRLVFFHTHDTLHTPVKVYTSKVTPASLRILLYCAKMKFSKIFSYKNRLNSTSSSRYAKSQVCRTFGLGSCRGTKRQTNKPQSL